MKIWEYNKEAKKLQESTISLAGKTILILPGIETADNNLESVSNYIGIGISLKNNRNTKIYCASWTPDTKPAPESEDKQNTGQLTLSKNRINEIIKHNKAPYDHVNGMQGVVDEVFLPILKDKNRWQELDNLTIFANSYGTIALSQLENGIRKAMAGLDYSKEEQKAIMNRVCAIGVLPVTNIGNENISFKKIFFAPSNDRMNAGVNLNADHISSDINSKPHYKKIGDHGLLISAPAVPMKNIGGKLVGFVPKSPISMDTGHTLPGLLLQGDELYTSSNPDLFPVLIRTTINNSLNRESGLQDLTTLLKPTGSPSRFCERIQNKLLSEFVDNGEIKSNKKDIFVQEDKKHIVLPYKDIILSNGTADKKGLSL